MKEYTYNELVAMQEEAKQRVLEMQKKSKYAVEDMNSAFLRNTESTDEKTEKGPTFSCHSIPVAQQPRAIQYPTGIVNTDSDKHKNAHVKNVCEKTSDKYNMKNAHNQNETISKFFNVFGRLNSDESEKMLILALCMLLVNEQADENLIMALLYLIA